MNKSNVLIGVLAGAAAGALLGILFAPDKGSETRKKLATKANDSTDELKEKLEDIITQFTQKFKAANTEATDMYAKGKQTMHDVTNDIKTQLS